MTLCKRCGHRNRVSDFVVMIFVGLVGVGFLYSGIREGRGWEIFGGFFFAALFISNAILGLIETHLNGKLRELRELKAATDSQKR